ncbi:UbiA family prenyltransferase [Acidicapsa ligni]|uniref:UbiA family prenyltransferase n=1 Tax=Acidicapsa ligni TaxID=542300 RepID=UPI0021E02E87|nr:UbiA family prenyltransferase [Acidicapsa ligni]
MPVETLIAQAEIEGLPASEISVRDRIVAHIRIARLDHSVKQIFILPGIVLAMALTGERLSLALTGKIVLGLVAATLIACSNYVINEILDAPCDRLHPTKKYRPAACGLVHIGWGYAQWIGMMLVGLALASTISLGFLYSAAALWVMGCVYNIPPVRSKDLPYIDVLSESINNPLRFCLGWYIVASMLLPPLSLLLSYWMLGAYFMALKRFSEYRQIGDGAVAASYRKSFHYYREESLLNSVVFYAATSMLFFGAFIMRYRMELILAFPLVAWLMAVYFGLSFHNESAVQNPEKLYREPKLMIALGLCICAFVVLLFVDLPWIGNAFPKSLP